MTAEKLKELQELLEAHQMMYDTEGYVSTNTADYLIKTVTELAEQLAAHQQENEILRFNRDEQAEMVRSYEAAKLSFLQEYEFEHGCQRHIAGGNTRYQKGALEGFEHVKRLFDKWFN